MTYILQFDKLRDNSFHIGSGTDNHTCTITQNDIMTYRPNLPLGRVKICNFFFLNFDSRSFAQNKGLTIIYTNEFCCNQAPLKMYCFNLKLKGYVLPDNNIFKNCEEFFIRILNISRSLGRQKKKRKKKLLSCLNVENVFKVASKIMYLLFPASILNLPVVYKDDRNLVPRKA